MTIGAFSSPLATRSFRGHGRTCRVRRSLTSNCAMGGPWNFTFFCAMVIQRLRCSFWETFPGLACRCARCLKLRRKEPPSERGLCLRRRVDGCRRERIRVLHACFESEGADIVAVVKGDGAEFLQIEHTLDVLTHGGNGMLAVFLRIFFAQLNGLIESHAIGNIAADRVVSAGLVGKDIGDYAAFGQLWNQVGTIAN